MSTNVDLKLRLMIAEAQERQLRWELDDLSGRLEAEAPLCELAAGLDFALRAVRQLVAEGVATSTC